MTQKPTIYSLLIAFFLFLSQAGTARAVELPFDFKLDAGYRLDNLRWNISGDSSGQNPNILSELTWSNVKVLQITGLAALPLGKSLFLQGTLAYGVILLGNNQDSDYLWG